MSDLTRRRFLQGSTSAAAALAVAGELCSDRQTAGAGDAEAAVPFASDWHRWHDRVWLGPDYWANPLQDWRLAGGRIECIHAAPDRNVHLLTRQLAERPGELRMSVRVGRVGDLAFRDGKGSAGFRLGIRGPLNEYRNSLIFGTGLNAGVAADGRLFVGDLASPRSERIPLDSEAVELRLAAVPQGNGYAVTLSAHHPEAGQEFGRAESMVAAGRLSGNIALVANYGGPQRNAGPNHPGFGRFWFADWRMEGSKVESHPDRAFGPILFSQYTLSEGILKLTAQMCPAGEKESQSVRLQTRGGAEEWRTIAEEPIHPQARTATFRIENWDATSDVPYRLAYTAVAADGSEEERDWTGTIRRDPAEKPVLTVPDISCNIHAAFPNQEYVEHTAKMDPDLIAFTGDQFYESTGGYGIIREPLDLAILDYLRKWSMHGWTWRELMRDRPSISIPDDHDVYQGNIWGEAGAPREGTQEMGGYDMHPEWVNVVHRTQTSHHPDAYDPTPVRQDISVYYGPMTYGRVSFAILADRQFKTAPEGVVPATGGRGDHVTDPNFDPGTADVPGAELLGERQLEFLREWGADWRGADMKCVVSQTIFTSMATTHGGPRQRLRADYDTNGWPQTARNAALREIRKAFATHIGGDQHLPAVVHYGIDEHADAGVAFAGPAVNVGYPRWWEPEQPGRNRPPGAPELTGDFVDHMGHPLRVLAVANGAVEPRKPVMELLEDRASGLGIVRFDKANRRVTFECWPFRADPTKDPQFPGWPVTFGVLVNYGRQAKAHLPLLEIGGVENPVVQVVDETDGEIVYTLRVAGTNFRPHVFAPGSYTIRVSEPETGRLRELKGVEATPENAERLKIELA